MALGLMSVVVLVWADVEDGKGGVSAGGKRVITQYYYITLCITGSLIVKRFKVFKTIILAGLNSLRQKRC